MKKDNNSESTNTQSSQTTVSDSAFKDFQFLFDGYILSEEEQDWCRKFENHSGLEPIYTYDVTDKKSFIDMIKQNNQHILDLAQDAVSVSERIAYKLSYYFDVA